MTSEAEFATTMQAIVDAQVAAQDRDNWLAYGILPSTRRLYALWREQDGEPFGDCLEFEQALNEITERVTWQAANGTGSETRQEPMLLRLERGRRWVHPLVLMSNCCADGMPKERRDYARALFAQGMKDARREATRLNMQIEGLDALVRGLNQDVDGPMLVRVAKEYGLDRAAEGGVLAEGEALFEDERLVTDNEDE